MAGDKRHKDANWQIAMDANGVVTFDGAHLAVLMDIRDELKKLNARPDCPAILAIPRVLRRISANTAKPRKKAGQ